jgi:hypothetical protein
MPFGKMGGMAGQAVKAAMGKAKAGPPAHAKAHGVRGTAPGKAAGAGMAGKAMGMMKRKVPGAF